MPKPVSVSTLRVVTDVRALAIERGYRYSPVEAAGDQSLAASTGLPQDRELLHDGGRIAEHLYAAGGGAEGIRRWCSQLGATSRERFDESFVCEIPDALVVGELGVVVTPHGEILHQSNLGARQGSSLPWVLRSFAEPPATLRGTHVSLLTFASKSYAHWLLDSLPRLALVSPDDPAIRVVVPAEPTAFQLESLAMLRIGEDRVVRHSPPVQRVERLLLAVAASTLANPRRSHLLAVRDALLRARHRGGKPPRSNRRVYVSRARSSRPVDNELEILPIVRDFGFDVVASEALPYAEQVALFSEAEAVLGAHGAGMHNHLFNPNAASVIELYNPKLWTPSVLRTASICGHAHFHVFEQNVGSGLQTRVDPERLRSLLAQALPSRPPR
jgi:hypothetical protein